eukprot:8547-Hanusia_phi.AAC.1
MGFFFCPGNRPGYQGRWVTRKGVGWDAIRVNGIFVQKIKDFARLLNTIWASGVICGTLLEPTSTKTILSAPAATLRFLHQSLKNIDVDRRSQGSLIPGANYSAQDDHAGVKVAGL